MRHIRLPGGPPRKIKNGSIGETVVGLELGGRAAGLAVAG